MINTDNLSMLCDFYDLTMANGYLASGNGGRVACFDAFFRSVPDGGGFAIAAGLKDIIEYIRNLRFDDGDIAYLRGKNIFSEEFLDYLRNFRFTGSIWAVPEGTPVFPLEPILTVKAPVMEAHLIETFVLLQLNHQSLIATKANRIVRAAQGRPVMEFGARRAHGADAAVTGARAAYIGGCAGTSCALTDLKWGIPTMGTMTHSWVQMFDTEYEAFRTYCGLYPDNPVLLIDTYNVMQSGLPNAIRAFKEVLLPRGLTKCSVRIDSGDISYLSKKVRRILDEEGLFDCRIIASNSLDEYIIRDLMMQNARIDSFIVGERLVTAASSPMFGCVYKLVAVENGDGELIPKINLSENTGKITTPHFKRVCRFFDKETGKAVADEVMLADETFDPDEPHKIFDENATWKIKVLENYTVEDLLIPVFTDGELVYTSPSEEEIRAYCFDRIDTLWDEIKRFENPHKYYVDLSEKLWQIKRELIGEKRSLD